MLTHFCLLRAAVILQSQNSKTFLGSMSRNTFSLLFILEYRRANSPREDTLKTVVVFFFHGGTSYLFLFSLKHFFEHITLCKTAQENIWKHKMNNLSTIKSSSPYSIFSKFSRLCIYFLCDKI